MGFLLNFLDSHTSIDWNGDGKIDSWDDVLEVAMLTQMLDDDAREERIRKIVDAIVRRGTCHIANEEFEELCRQEGLRARKTLTRAISTRSSGGWIGTEPLRGR